MIENSIDDKYLSLGLSRAGFLTTLKMEAHRVLGYPAQRFDILVKASDIVIQRLANNSERLENIGMLTEEPTISTLIDFNLFSQGTNYIKSYPFYKDLKISEFSKEKIASLSDIHRFDWFSIGEVVAIRLIFKQKNNFRDFVAPSSLTNEKQSELLRRIGARLGDPKFFAKMEREMRKEERSLAVILSNSGPSSKPHGLTQ